MSNGSVWQDALVTTPSLMQEATQFMRRYRRRAVRDVITAALMTVVFIAIALSSRDPWVCLGALFSTGGAAIGLWWTVSARPPAPSVGVPNTVAYRRLLDHGIDVARSAAMWTVLPIIPGTACIGIGLILAAASRDGLPGFAPMMGLGVLLGLVVCWRVLWQARTDHTAELLARRDALNDDVAESRSK